jgi:hypothetical protein
MKTFILICSSILAANVASAQTAPNILGTWDGTHENTDPANSAFGQVNAMEFDVLSEVGTSISGDIDWLSGQPGGCPISPCTTTWSGTISSSGQLSIVGEFGDDYTATLVGSIAGGTISGSFTGPDGGNVRGYGVWEVTSAPEISSASAVSALTLLFGGLLVVTERSRRKSLRVSQPR